MELSFYMTPKSEKIYIVNSGYEVDMLLQSLHNVETFGIQYKCLNCGNTYTIYRCRYNKSQNYNTLLCEKCKHVYLSNNNPEWQTKGMESYYNKHGVISYFSIEENRNIAKNNEIAKYGGKLWCQTDEGREAKSRKTTKLGAGTNAYLYKGEKFDSSWELMIYIFCKDYNIPIIRKPCVFNYIYDGVVCTYYPDFMINGILYEVKGSQFYENFDPATNRMKSPKDEVKRLCAVSNNVHFITKYNMAVFKNHIKTFYPKNYLDNFKVSNPYNLCYGHTPYTITSNDPESVTLAL